MTNETDQIIAEWKNRSKGWHWRSVNSGKLLASDEDHYSGNGVNELCLNGEPIIGASCSHNVYYIYGDVELVSNRLNTADALVIENAELWKELKDCLKTFDMITADHSSAGKFFWAEQEAIKIRNLLATLETDKS